MAFPSQFSNELREITRRRRLEKHLLARDRMHEPQLDRTQGQPRRAASVGLAGTKQRLGVDLLAAERMAVLGQDGCESDACGPFPGGIRSACSRRAARRAERASSPSCPTLGKLVLPRRPSPRSRTSRLSIVCAATAPRTTARYRRRMLWTRNCCPRCFSACGRAGEDHQAAGIAVQAMHGPHPPHRRPCRDALLPLGDQPRQQFVEGRLKLPLARRQFALLGVSRGGHAGRLFHHDQVLVEIAGCGCPASLGGRRQRMRQQLDHVGQPQPTAGVDAEIAADHHPPRFQAAGGPRTTTFPAATRAGRRRWSDPPGAARRGRFSRPIQAWIWPLFNISSLRQYFHPTRSPPMTTDRLYVHTCQVAFALGWRQNGGFLLNYRDCINNSACRRLYKAAG